MEILSTGTKKEIDNLPIQCVLHTHNPSDTYPPQLARWKNNNCLGNAS